MILKLTERTRNINYILLNKSSNCLINFLLVSSALLFLVVAGFPVVTGFAVVTDVMVVVTLQQNLNNGEIIYTS
jgi:hypothetical protein